jgi:hypothetical protein
MLKLGEKRQTLRQQRQAARSVNVYRDILLTLAHNQTDKIPTNEDNSKKQGDKNPWDEIFRQLNEAIRIRNYSKKTYTTYANWIGRFEHFVRGKAPDAVEMSDVKAFLSDLAVRRRVAASTQNQAFNALLFLFRHLLDRGDEFDAKEGIVRASAKTTNKTRNYVRLYKKRRLRQSR